MISTHEFKKRRKQLMRRMKKGSIALLPSSKVQVRNKDVEYPYRQNSDFYYLTGFNEAEALLVLIPGRAEGEFVLFCREFDEEKAVWTGHHAGLIGALEQYGADEAYPIGSLSEVLPGLLQGAERIYFPIGQEIEFDQQVMSAVKALRSKVRLGVKPPTEFFSIEVMLHDMRLFKSSAEIAAMRKAIAVSVSAHKRAMQACRPGLFEYQIEAELLHEFTRHGLRSHAYPSIVAGGENACVLHYVENSDVLRDGDLLLIDAGAEYQNYAADITRTFPVNGKFSEPQKLIYELVLAAQAAAIKKIRPGARWNEPHEAAVKVLTKGLVELGLLSGSISKLIKDEAYKPFYMHKTGHWLGMDVHDVGDYQVDGEWRLFEPGMVLTVEPGLYIPHRCTEVESQWRGIGIRIEDDVLVVEKGCEVLTEAMPKSVEDIENLMQVV